MLEITPEFAVSGARDVGRLDERAHNFAYSTGRSQALLK